jgi:hypothetical protein
MFSRTEGLYPEKYRDGAAYMFSELKGAGGKHQAERMVIEKHLEVRQGVGNH